MIRYSVTKEHLLGFLFSPSFYFPVIPSRARVEPRLDLILSSPVFPADRMLIIYVHSQYGLLSTMAGKQVGKLGQLIYRPRYI